MLYLLNRKTKTCSYSGESTINYNGNYTIKIQCHRMGNIVVARIAYTGTMPSSVIDVSNAASPVLTIPEGYRPINTAYMSYACAAGTSVYGNEAGRWSINSQGAISHGGSNEDLRERSVAMCYITDDPFSG